VGFGVKNCGIPFGDDAYILAMLDKSTVTICDDIHRLIESISEHSSHATFSMAYYFCMHRANFLAGAIPPRLTKYFCAKIDEKLRWAFASALGMDLLAAPADAVPYAAFTAYRAQLPTRLGGVDMSLLSNRHLYLNMLTMVLPQLIDIVGEDGIVKAWTFQRPSSTNSWARVLRPRQQRKSMP
jgi:hypothetical protein